MPEQVITIGLLVFQDGPSGIWAPSAEASAVLAVNELNAVGGILGRDVALHILDPGTTARSAAAAAAAAVEIEGTDAIVGMMPSFARGSVAAAIGNRVPYVYTPQFEGCGLERGVMAVGETAEDLLRPGIAFMTGVKRASRFFLVGNDYVWPRGTFETARPIIAAEGGRVVGEMLLPFGFSDYGMIFEAIRRSRADVVVPYFLGAESISFNRAFAEAGLGGRVLRFSSAIDETVLYGIGEDATENLFVSSAYFANVRSRNNGGFLERYHGLFGDCPPPANAFGQSCYEGIHCLAGLVEAAGALRVADVRRRLCRAVQSRTARGFETTSIAGARRPVHIAEIDGCEVRTIAQR